MKAYLSLASLFRGKPDFHSLQPAVPSNEGLAQRVTRPQNRRQILVTLWLILIHEVRTAGQQKYAGADQHPDTLPKRIHLAVSSRGPDVTSAPHYVSGDTIQKGELFYLSG
jgi:hypothetical protein